MVSCLPILLGARFFVTLTDTNAGAFGLLPNLLRIFRKGKFVSVVCGIAPQDQPKWLDRRQQPQHLLSEAAEAQVF